MVYLLVSCSYCMHTQVYPFTQSIPQSNPAHACSSFTCSPLDNLDCNTKNYRLYIINKSAFFLITPNLHYYCLPPSSPLLSSGLLKALSQPCLMSLILVHLLFRVHLRMHPLPPITNIPPRSILPPTSCHTLLHRIIFFFLHSYQKTCIPPSQVTWFDTSSALEANREKSTPRIHIFPQAHSFYLHWQ